MVAYMGTSYPRPPCVKGAVSRKADWGIVGLRSTPPSTLRVATSPYTGEALGCPLRFFAGALQLAAQLLSFCLTPLLAKADTQLAEGVEIIKHGHWNKDQG